MKILITGCRGQLGTELQHQLSAEDCAIGPLPERLRKATVIPVDVDELDITDREATINYIRRHQPVPSSTAPLSRTWTAARPPATRPLRSTPLARAIWRWRVRRSTRA